jgi:hypothetical protein
MIRYLLAVTRFRIQAWWLILTGRGHDDAPESLFQAYDRQVSARNRRDTRS